MSEQTTFFLARINAEIDRARQEAREHGWRWQERPQGQHTIGDLVSAVLAIDSPTDAGEFYVGYLGWLASQAGRPGFEAMVDPSERERVVRANIGWCFGEGMHSDRIAMWHRVTAAVHPVFGVTMPGPAVAFQLGMEYGRRGRGPGDE